MFLNFNVAEANAVVDGDGLTVKGVYYEVDINVITKRIDSDNYILLNLALGHVTIIKESTFRVNMKMDVEQLID